jgi:hypothetical protein
MPGAVEPAGESCPAQRTRGNSAIHNAIQKPKEFFPERITDLIELPAVGTQCQNGLASMVAGRLKDRL